MDEKYSDLDLEKAMKLSQSIEDHGKKTVSFIAELDKRVTNTNFLTNGGGAVAVLAFMGSSAKLPLIEYSLFFFLLGIILTGVELRALLKYWAILHKDIGRRLDGFINNELSVKQCLTPVGLGKTYQDINHYAGWLSQLCFIGGVIVGGSGFLLCSSI
jgi:hypothetical protein